MTVIHFVKFVIKLLLVIILLPFFLLWVYVRYRIFRFSLIKETRKTNMPKDYSKDLANEMSIKKMFVLQQNDKYFKNTKEKPFNEKVRVTCNNKAESGHG